MVRHDAPRAKSVPVAVEVAQSFGNSRCDLGLGQPACPVPRVQRLPDLLRVQIGQPFLLLCRQLASTLPGCDDNGFAFPEPSLANGRGYRVGQAEADVVDAAVTCPMGEILSRADLEAPRVKPNRRSSQSVSLWFLGRRSSQAVSVWFLGSSARATRPRGPGYRRGLTTPAGVFVGTHQSALHPRTGSELHAMLARQPHPRPAATSSRHNQHLHLAVVTLPHLAGDGVVAELAIEGDLPDRQ